ncbi:sulfurtransferase [Pseudohongiella sp.]|uniref:Rhodanese domain-containing protein n=1 Tax=marine sediment metagenome TaxID=412755 RepID=A0A0F9W3E9_9ZZZZ|nr:rhodanese-like domain-containing protein [Pseudohongiella sp.]
MKRMSLLLLLVLSPIFAVAAPQGWAPLLEPAQLSDLLAGEHEIRVLHLTGNYDEGHIPGAVSAPYAQFRGPQENAGQLPALSELTRIVQELGIDANTPLVLVHGGSGAVDMGAATRVYWTMKSLGVDTLAILNGGFAAWQAAELPVTTDTVAVSATDFQPQWNGAYQTTTAQMETLVAEGDAQIVDARPQPYFAGEQASAARAGTLPGATNLSFTAMFDGNRMKTGDELSAMLDSAIARDAPLTVTFCNTGHLGSIDWFAISELGGYDNTRLYAESITEWAMDPERPMVNEPADN